MKVLKFKNQSSAIARQLLIEAKQNEPPITKDVKGISQICGAKVVGLRKKFKSVESLTRKIEDKAESWNSTIYFVAKRINDVLRYTFLVTNADYSNCLEKVCQQFITKHYQVKKIYNFWEFENTKKDGGYRGINLTIISFNKQEFELQLHTKASFQLKSQTHNLYEEFRMPTITEGRKNEIKEIMIEKASKLIKPQGV